VGQDDGLFIIDIVVPEMEDMDISIVGQRICQSLDSIVRHGVGTNM